MHPRKLVNLIDIIDDNQQALKPLQYKNLGDILSVLKERSGLAFRLDMDHATANPFTFISVISNEAQLNEARLKLEAMKNEGLISYCVRENKQYGTIHVVIDSVNPFLSVEISEKQQQETLNKLEPTLESTTKTKPTSRPALKSLSKEDLNNKPFIQASIAQASTDLFIKDKGALANYVMRHFEQYAWIAEILMMEYICRGNLAPLKEIMAVQLTGSFTEIKTTHLLQTSSLFSPAIKETEKTKEQRYAIQLKANFDMQIFADYVNKKREHASEHFLGEKSEVENCLRYVCGENSPRVTAILTALQKINAFKTIESMFTF